jgi:hypothetical protein
MFGNDSNKLQVCKILCSYSNADKIHILMGYGAVLGGNCLPKFGRIFLLETGKANKSVSD